MANKIINLDHEHTVISGKYYENGEIAEVQNGTIVGVEKVLLGGETEIFKCKKAEDGDTLVGVVCTPEVQSDTQLIEKFTNDKGSTIRIALFENGKIFSATDEDAEVGDEKSFGKFTLTCIQKQRQGRHTFTSYIETEA